jgi:hypothetical protein
MRIELNKIQNLIEKNIYKIAKVKPSMAQCGNFNRAGNICYAFRVDAPVTRRTPHRSLLLPISMLNQSVLP